jgi:hypothetical protein
MEYQNTAADERLIAKFEKEENDMLLKYYGLKKSDSNCPINFHLLKPENLHLTSYQVLSNNLIKLNIGYSRNWSGFVTNTMRMNYTQYILGTIYCENVETYENTAFNNKASIQIPFFSNSKILNLPIQNTHNVKIKCKNIRVEQIDIYVKDNNGEFKLDRDFIAELNK